MTVPRLGWGIDAPLSIPQARKMLLYTADGSPLLHLDDASGNVGIGTASPTTNLHVLGVRDDVHGQLKIEASDGFDARLELWNPDGQTSTGRASIMMSKFSGFEGLRFLINGVDKMILDEDGNVGIGTVSPNDKLHLFNSGTQVALQIESGSATGSPLVEFRNSTPQYWQLGITGANEAFLLFDGTASTTPVTVEKMAPDNSLYIDSSGDVGIGTASPATDWHLLRTGTLVEARVEASGVNSLAGVSLKNDVQTFSLITHGVLSDACILIDSTASTAPFRLDTGAPTDSLRILGSGFVGLGVAAPTSVLDIGAGAITGAEMTAPAAPAVNDYRIYGEDNGAGKTRVMIKFNTGSPQQIAIQP